MDGAGRGKQVIFTNINTLVYGAGPHAEYAPPVFNTVSAQRVLVNGNPSSVSFAVNVVDRGGGIVKRVVAAYNDGPAGNGTWRFVDLTFRTAPGEGWDR